jgi:GNAT superfamily N-acetyltransferase
VLATKAWIIRVARPCPDDAARLKALEAATLGDSDLSAAEMQAVLARPEQTVYLAEAGPETVGLLAVFETVAPDARRLELDMLGVAEPWRGHGIARALVQRAIADGLEKGIRCFRAIVAADNAASLAVFRQLGLDARGGVHDLLTYGIQGTVPQPYLPPGWREIAPSDRAQAPSRWPGPLLAYRHLPGYRLVLLADERGAPVAGAALLTVHTIAYSGIWIEEHQWQDRAAMRAVARAAVEYAKFEALDEVGLLLDSSAESCVYWAFAGEGYQRAGRYYSLERHHEI